MAYDDSNPPIAPRFVMPQTMAPAITPPSIPSAPLMSDTMPQMSAPVAPTAIVNHALDSPVSAAQQTVNHLRSTGSGIDQIQNPLLRGLARAADITGAVAGSVFAPLRVAEALIPGTQEHHSMLVRQADNRLQVAQAQQMAQSQQADEDAQTQQRQALAAKASLPQYTYQQTDDGLVAIPQGGTAAVPVTAPGGGVLGKPLPVEKPKTIEEQAYEYAKSQGKNPLDAYSAVLGAKNTRDAGLPQQYLDAISSGDDAKAQLIKRVINDTQVQPKIEVHAATERPESGGTWQMVMDKDNNPKFFNTKTGEVRDNVAGIQKPKGDRASTDEQKRADMAHNLNENLDAMEDILNRRPELFGPIAGRMTDLKAATGTDDPDIAKMINIKHQLGMVAQSTHGMRSAQGIETAANGLLNGFHNSPAATRAALESGRSSAKTFLGDANNPGQSRGAGSTPSSTPSAKAWNPKTGRYE